MVNLCVIILTSISTFVHGGMRMADKNAHNSSKVNNAAKSNNTSDVVMHQKAL